MAQRRQAAVISAARLLPGVGGDTHGLGEINRFVDLSPRLKIASLLVVPKYVLQYESAEDVRTKAPIHFAAHKARWHEFLDQGTLLMIGTFADLEGSMAVFSTREAAEEFARSDPFVLNGVVSSWRVREWNEAIT